MPTVLTAVAVACLAHGGAMAQSAVASTQLPTGGVVNAGQASISQVGSTLNVNQSSQRPIVDSTSFNVGQSATVNFQQPNAQSSTLNRVMDTRYDSANKTFTAIEVPAGAFPMQIKISVGNTESVVIIKEKPPSK